MLAWLPTRTGPGWAGWDSKEDGDTTGFVLGFLPNPHSYGSQAQQPTARWCSGLRPRPALPLPAPTLDPTTLDIRLSGLLVHDLWVTPLSLSQAHALNAALPSSWDLTSGSGGARPAAPGAIWVTELCLAAK